MSDPAEEPVIDPSLYTTLEELKVLMGIDPITSATDTLLNARLNGMISVISRSIDVYCRRHFYAREEVRTYYIPKSERGKPWRIWLGYDLLTLETLETVGEGGVVFDPSTYALRPVNQPVKGWIELRHDLIYGLPWSLAREDTVEAALTGTWGFVTPESTAMVRSACQLWIMELNQRSLYPGAQSVSIGDYSYSFRGDSEQRLSTTYGQTVLTPPGQIGLLLNGFRRLEFAGSSS